MSERNLEYVQRDAYLYCHLGRRGGSTGARGAPNEKCGPSAPPPPILAQPPYCLSFAIVSQIRTVGLLIIHS